jgi:hypothetical protein
MSGGPSISFIDFAAFSFEFDHVRYVSVPSFLVRTYLVVSHDRNAGWGQSVGYDLPLTPLLIDSVEQAPRRTLVGL